MKRQLAAILYADVVGYSRLTDHNEEKTHQLLRTSLDYFTDVIKKHHGLKIKEAGDAILAEFNSAIDSVNCAIGFQSEMGVRNAELGEEERFDFRIGRNPQGQRHGRRGVHATGPFEALARVRG